MAELTLKQVRKSFGALEVIKGIDLEVASGEFVVFVGPSGCGKSTLLRIIAGLEDATSGTLTIGGKDVTYAEPSERGIAMVFQSYALYPHMTVAENIGFGLSLARRPKAEIAAKVAATAETAAADPAAGEKSRKHSPAARGSASPSAERSSAIPKVFLFDEPLSISTLRSEPRCVLRSPICTPA
ncbi:ABC transporter ATP-binding protein [Rhizobium beringeri]